MAEMGRPKIQIDHELLKKMCQIQCTRSEMCGILDISEKTLDRIIKDEYDMTFSTFFKKYSAGGKMSLRRAQFKKAVEDGNTAMLIWLGKQYLGQRDNIDIDNGQESVSKKMAEVLTQLEKNATDNKTD